jgi:hypothetical protein
MPAPSTEGTPIEAVKKQRDKRADGLSESKKRESEELVELIQQKKTTRLVNKESEKHKVDLKRMEKMPLKMKGKKDESEKKKKKKKKKDTGKDKSPREEGRKKATFSETVGKEKVN